MIEFGKDKEFKEFCPKCGRAIYEGDKGCPVYHFKKAPKRGRFSGRSRSPNKFNDYQ